MPETRTIEERLRAVERTLGNRNGPSDAACRSDCAGDREDGVSNRLDRLEDRVAELEAGLQAVRGYVSNLDHVNESVERRANAAIAAVERLDRTPRTPPNLATVQRPAAADRNAAHPIEDTSAERSSAEPTPAESTLREDGSAETGRGKNGSVENGTGENGSVEGESGTVGTSADEDSEASGIVSSLRALV